MNCAFHFLDLRPLRSGFFLAAVRAILLATMCALAACGGSGGDDDQATLVAPQYAPAARARIMALMAATGTPGAVVLVRSPQGDWLEAFGTRTLGGSDAVRVTDYFRVGSITKTWTATVALQLVDEGLLALDDPVSFYVAGVPNGAAIRIEDLMTMRSGLFNYTRDKTFQQRLLADPFQPFYPADSLALALARAPQFLPGEQFDYSNTNTVLLGRIIEQVTGARLEDLFRERLFAPLGLYRTFMPALNRTALPAPYARGYEYFYTAGQDQVDLLDESIDAGGSGAGTVAVARDATDWNASWSWAAGMGISTAQELATFVEQMVGGGSGLLSARLQAQRLRSCLPTAPPGSGSPDYCLGLARTGAFFGHAGQIPGYNTYMGHDPVSRTTIVAWTSVSSTADDRSPGVEIADALMEELGF